MIFKPWPECFSCEYRDDCEAGETEWCYWTGEPLPVFNFSFDINQCHDFELTRWNDRQIRMHLIIHNKYKKEI